MNNRINETFSKLTQNNKKAFIPFIMSGYPNSELCLDILKTLSDSKCDLIEIGMPFTDPQADGPTIQMADVVALKNNTTVESTLNTIKEFRKYDSITPIIWMGYYNSLYKYGLENFAQKAKESGVDGILTVDLPPEENKPLAEILKKYSINNIHLATPTTTKERLPIILENASGFLYYVSVKGITGTKEINTENIKENISYIKSQTTLPLCVGFGINNSQKAKAVQSFSDGVIVGSALIKKINSLLDEKNQITTSKEKFLKEINDFISEFTLIP